MAVQKNFKLLRYEDIIYRFKAHDLDTKESENVYDYSKKLDV